MDNNEKKKIQSVQLKLQNGQVDIILRALELYKYNLRSKISISSGVNNYKGIGQEKKY